MFMSKIFMFEPETNASGKLEIIIDHIIYVTVYRTQSQQSTSTCL